MSDLQAWYETSKNQQREYETVASSPEATQTITRSAGTRATTPAVTIVCGPHESGWSVRLRKDAGAVVLDFIADPASDRGSLRHVHLKAMPGSGSIEVRCQACGRSSTRQASKVLGLVLASLDSPRVRNGHKFLRIT